MTDITELAQSLKAAAIDAKELAIIARYSKGRAAAEKFYALANPNNVIALVEALEKAQQERDNWRTSFDNERFRADKLKAYIDEMTEERNASINELSRIIQKEVKAKRETEQRIAELESRTVKLPAERFCPAEYAGSQLWSETEVWNKAITACADELRAAGIKVEAE
ncbi:TPA: hypothetical protein M2P12_001656 [Klebsiella variicola]|nr:hypothetical protein [Klebsiella variicola]